MHRRRRVCQYVLGDVGTGNRMASRGVPVVGNPAERAGAHAPVENCMLRSALPMARAEGMGGLNLLSPLGQISGWG